MGERQHAVVERDFVPYAAVEQLRSGRAVIAHEGQALLDLSRRLDTSFCAAIELLRNCSQTVLITGVGKAGIIGQKIAATMCSTGTRARFLHPTEALHGDMGCLTAQDVVLVLSNSGESEEICRLLPLLREQGLPTIAITAHRQSSVGRQVDVVVELGQLVEAGAHGLAPSTSTTAMLAVGDALAFVVSHSKGFTPNQFAVFHPAGSLGRRLQSVRDIMRQGDQLRISDETATIREVLATASRPGRRTGAVMLVDETGRLTGLFTDSDLARLLELRREMQLDRPISEVMTPKPLTVRETAILEEVVQLLGARRFSELPVVDEQGHPCGLVDITDIIGLLPAEQQMS